MRYRIYFEPMDIDDAYDIKEARILAAHELLRGRVSISKILPIDNDGFVIEQPHAETPSYKQKA